MLRTIKIIFNFFIAYKPIFLYSKKISIKYKNFLFIFLFLYYLQLSNYFFYVKKKKKKMLSFLNAPNRNKKAQMKLICFYYNIFFRVIYSFKKIVKKKFSIIFYVALYLKTRLFESSLLLLQNRTINFYFYALNKNKFI